MFAEFLLGEDILVAPVLQKGAKSRDIYLPKGYWKDQVRNESEIIKGPVWLHGYPADLDVLPYFIKVNDNSDEKNDEKKKTSTANATKVKSLKLLFGAIILIYFYNLWAV